MRFFILVSTIATLAAGYSSGGGYGGNSLVGGNSGSQGFSSGEGRVKGPITAAIESQRSVEVRPVQSMPREPLEPQIIEVPSDDMPVTVHFKSQSSRVLIQQTHTPAAASEPEHTSSEDEPQRVIHEVVKPVIQEVREIIQPYRRLIQQIQPVIEQTHTVIAKGEPRPQVAPLGINDLNGGDGAGASGKSVSSSSGIAAGSPFGGQVRSNDYAAAASSQQTSQMTVKSVPESVIRIHKPTGVSQGATAGHTSHGQSVSSQAAPSGRDQPSKFPMAIQQLFNQHATPSQQDQHQPEQKHSRQAQHHYQQPQQQHHQYSNRQGEIPRSVQYTPARMTLKPAPVVKYLPMDQQYQRRSARYISRPKVSYLPTYQGYELSPEEMQLLSFVAQPVRFRARA